MSVLPNLRPETIRRRIAEARETASRAQADALRTIDELRERCPHDYQYEGDPSGNNDSGYECRICGDTRRRLP